MRTPICASDTAAPARTKMVKLGMSRVEKTCRRPLPQHRKKPARRACTSLTSYAVGMTRQYLCFCTSKRQYLYFCTSKAGRKAPVGMKRVCIASRMLWCAMSVSIRHSDACLIHVRAFQKLCSQHTAAYGSIRRHTSAYGMLPHVSSTCTPETAQERGAARLLRFKDL
jgi:hypothetical protein